MAFASFSWKYFDSRKQHAPSLPNFSKSRNVCLHFEEPIPCSTAYTVALPPAKVFFLLLNLKNSTCLLFQLFDMIQTLPFKRSFILSAINQIKLNFLVNIFGLFKFLQYIKHYTSESSEQRCQEGSKPRFTKLPIHAE